MGRTRRSGRQLGERSIAGVAPWVCGRDGCGCDGCGCVDRCVGALDVLCFDGDNAEVVRLLCAAGVVGPALGAAVGVLFR